jgi:uncharacterized circularly permuted ATP-grasp superfamily protein/uncharacterized alpha-E superfamily protein
MVPNMQSGAIFQNYFSDNYSYDELLGKDGNLRPHWETFFTSFAQTGEEEMQNRNNDISRLLKENGVTYNIYGDSAGMNRPWKLDIIPFLIGREEWKTIETGLIQRAELLDLILKDIYGERKLIRDGLLPMDLVYNHAGFLRQCSGIKVNGKHSLILYSADMARSPDGKIWIVNERTQAPSGSGYALENRIAMTRILPELFSGLKVRQLSSYFNALRNALNEMAPHQKQNPRIVVLTPGPGNETYFEHSYLSSHLGFTLVEGYDLMVKDNYVWLKTLGGLEKVDVIVRRVDDVYCDPLELRGDSQLGVPGLLQVIRSGNVSVANPLGSSILESPGLMPFLQNISRYFFKKDLILPTIASWWCGQSRELKYVLEHIPSLVIKEIHRNFAGSSSTDGSMLSTRQISELKQQIQAHPYLYVGQEKVRFSSTPSYINGKIEPRNTLFRSFLVSNKDSYTAMAGGLSRTSAEAGNFIISNQLGGFSKDAWIISPEPEEPKLKVHTEFDFIEIPTPSGILPSHTAENLFWVGRYTERLLGNARFLRTVIQFITEGNRQESGNIQETERSLLQALTQYSFTYPGFIGKQAREKFKDPWDELKDVLFNHKRQGGLSYNFTLFNNAVFAVRDHWSTDTWRVLRGMEEQWQAAVLSPQHGHLKKLNALNSLITSIVAFMGLNRESILREQGWVMLDTGRKMEQSQLMVSLLRSTLVNKHNEQIEYFLQECVLVTSESLVNYRYKYRASIQLSLVLDLMLLDPSNPRSLVYQVERLKTYLENLPKSIEDPVLPEQERLIGEAYTLLKSAERDQLALPDDKETAYLQLDIFLSKLYTLLCGITEVISNTYFKHAQAQTQLFSVDSI